ncbi:hypothetical protein [Brevibacterium aurantiacum]|uniref:Uncharacterized protein n=1 Tax=Brevibacterium aurantiacum TaxID=273384 RepID=A0A2A3ZST0_BREAU|nr:hypothetical protein [Brevibacterium aurantiacum]AZL10118.1 hypothetical protein CXR26_13485 [Brevibacterium aurantiacum]PCC54576.1 hypothetical protein CIK59_06055 [Brevibacterium aurantiacum]
MKRTLLATIAVTALMLAGCSTNSAPKAESDTQTPAQEEVATAEPTPLSQAEWVELCGPEGTAPDDPQCTADMGTGDEEPLDDSDFMEKQGEWFIFTTTDDESILEKWDVRVDSVELADVLPGAKSNGDWEGSDEIPEYVDAKPAEGNEFLHAEYTVKNTNQKPLGLPLEASVQFSDGEVFAPFGEDASDYTWNLNQQHENTAGDTQNSGTETQGDFVIEIPKGSEIEALIITDAFMGSSAESVIAIDPAT